MSEDELRRIFNEARFYERMLAGEFHASIVEEYRKKRGDRRVRNTRSQTVEYFDRKGQLIARVHQFVMKDGTLGASGKPDPKAVLFKGVWYLLNEREQWDLPAW